MPGPARTDPGDRRRRNTEELTYLPASGRDGDLPAWPLGTYTIDPDADDAPLLVGIHERELAVWAQLWATPQAVAWEQLGWHRVVARYTRRLVEAELPGSPASLNGEVRQLEDRLGLSPMAMKRLQWKVVADEVTPRRQAKAQTATGGKGAKKRRLMAVDPAQAADG